MVVPRAIKEDDRISIVMVAKSITAMEIAVTIRNEILVLTAEIGTHGTHRQRADGCTKNLVGGLLEIIRYLNQGW